MPSFSNTFGYTGLANDIHTYLLPKGTTIYHGSIHKIDNFNIPAYFSMNKNVSELFILLVSTRLTSVGIEYKNPYLYTFTTKKDIIIYQHGMDRNNYINTAFDQNSPNNILHKKDFCDMEQDSGWVTFRDATPLPLHFRKHIFCPRDEILKKIDILQSTKKVKSTFIKGPDDIEEGLDTYYKDYVITYYKATNKFAYNNDSFYHTGGQRTMELVFCNPDKVLQLEKTTKLSYKNILKKGRNMIVNYLKLWADMPVRERYASMQGIANSIYKKY